MSEADVIVVGGGPAGASTSYYLARQGYDVTVLEKATFPRDKICGDGLTPRAVGELIRMGIDTTGWSRNLGIRGYGAFVAMEQEILLKFLGQSSPLCRLMVWQSAAENSTISSSSTP